MAIMRLAAVLAGLLLGTAASIVPDATLAASTCPPEGGCIEVSGTTLLRDGKPWVPKGVEIAGFVAPLQVLKGEYLRAHEHFGQAELDAAKSYGADLIRFQLSHPGLDPQSSLHSKAYVDSVLDAVKLARKNHFSVLLVAQDQPQSGETHGRPLPDDATAGLWRALAPQFASDTGVMFELFNEPFKVPSPENWSLWQDGMQRSIDAVRSTGARNVILVDGLGMAHNLTGALPLHDPTQQLVYAVHPYLWKLYRSPAAWDKYFGDFAQTHPVMASEWDALANRPYCTPDMVNQATTLLDYLKAHRIGIVGWAFDLPGTLIKDFWTPTTYDGFACGTPNQGPGELLSRSFHGR
jgi:endoglucanase